MNTHRSSIKTGGNQLLYKHFNLPDHSVLSMKVRIPQKIYHCTNNPNLSTAFRRKREKQLGTAALYGCNYHIDSIGNLTSPGCQSVNVFNLFNRTSRRHRSHGSRKYNKPEIHNVSLDGLLPFVNLQFRSSSIFARDCAPFPWTCYTTCTNLPWPYILLMLHVKNIDFMLLFLTFPKTGFSKLSGYVIKGRQKIAHSWK